MAIGSAASSVLDSALVAALGGSVEDDDDDYIRSLSINDQVAVANLVVRKSKNSKTTMEVQACLDFTGVPESQVLLWAANHKMIDLKWYLSGCTMKFINELVKQGPVCCPVLEAESIFDDPATKTKTNSNSSLCGAICTWSTSKPNSPKILADIATEYFCSLHIEEQVAVIDFVVCMNDRSEDLILQTRLDFTGVPDSQVLLWAARDKMEHLHIALSNCDKALLKDLAKLGVCRHASSAGAPFGDSVKNQNRAMVVAQGMSAEERADLIKRLQEMDK